MTPLANLPRQTATRRPSEQRRRRQHTTAKVERPRKSRPGAARAQDDSSGSRSRPLAPDQGVDGVAARQRREAPGTRRGAQRLEQLAVEQMTGAHAVKMTDDRAACEIEVADRVEQLVADELVGIAQAALVEDGVAADDNGI